MFMEFSMEEAYQWKLNSNVIHCRKIFAVIHLIHKYLSDCCCQKRTFSHGTTSINALEEGLSKYCLNWCWQRQFSTIQNPFSQVKQTREVENLTDGTCCCLAHWSCFLLPLTTTVDLTFVAGWWIFVAWACLLKLKEGYWWWDLLMVKWVDMDRWWFIWE